MRIAFLGLGIMGKPMAQNLVKAGHEVKVWNRSSGKSVDGAHSASSPKEAARDAEIVWLCVSDTKSQTISASLAASFGDRKSTRLNSSHVSISYAVFCLKKKICNVPHR